MGLTIISKRDGTGVEVHEFKRKVKAAKKLIEDICEDVEAMEDEFGGEDYRERDGYRERSRYRYDDEPEYRHRRY